MFLPIIFSLFIGLVHGSDIHNQSHGGRIGNPSSKSARSAAGSDDGRTEKNADSKSARSAADSDDGGAEKNASSKSARSAEQKAITAGDLIGTFYMLIERVASEDLDPYEDSPVVQMPHKKTPEQYSEDFYELYRNASGEVIGEWRQLAQSLYRTFKGLMMSQKEILDRQAANGHVKIGNQKLFNKYNQQLSFLEKNYFYQGNPFGLDLSDDPTEASQERAGSVSR